MAIGIGTTAQVSSTTSSAQAQIQGALGLSTSGSDKKQNRIIDSIKTDIRNKLQQREEVTDILLLQDIDLDMYDELIVNIDKKIPDLVNEINVAIANVDAAYEARIDGDGRSDLKWETIVTDVINPGFGLTATTIVRYEVVKNDTRDQINRYGAKYFKRPKDRDYGASAVTDIPDASVGIGSTYIIVNNSNVTGGSFDGLRDIKVNDTITDSIEQPIVFAIGDLPDVIGFGSTSILGIKTTFEGSLSVGSTIVAFTGAGSTSSISIGDPLFRVGFTSTDSVVTGFGTTSISIVGVGTTGEPVETEVDTTAIYLDKVSIASTSQTTFNVGIYTTYPIIFINEISQSGATNENFHVIRNTGSDESFDPVTSGENPVEVGTISNKNKIGYGHNIALINNGDPEVVKTFIENVDPEPSVGAGFEEYYIGNFSWPGKNTPVYGGIGGTSIIGYTFNYVSLGDTLSVVSGVGATSSTSGIGVTDVGQSNPSTSVKNAQDQAITNAISNLNAIKSKNIPILNDLIAKSDTLRSIRNTKQSQAWGYRRARGFLLNEVTQAKKNLTNLENQDFTEYE